MKKTLKIVGVIIGLLPSLLLANEEKKTLVVTGHYDWAPFSYKNGKEISGVGTDLLGMILKDLNHSMKSVYWGNWERVLKATKKGDKIHAIVAGHWTKRKSKEYSYAKDWFIKDKSVIWVKKGKKFTFTRWNDLIGKKGLALRGDSYGQEFDTFMDAKLSVKRVNTSEQILKILHKDRADYYPYSLFAGKAQLERFNRADQFEYLEKEVTSEGIYFMFSQNTDPKLIEMINSRIEKYKIDGTIEKLAEKHIKLAAQIKEK